MVAQRTRGGNRRARDGSADQLRLVVALNESAKSLRMRSFEINLGALNAIVLSKSSGDRMRGFDKTSTQIQAWSRELHDQVEALTDLGREVVGLASAFIGQERRAELLGAAARGSKNRDAGQILAEADAELVVKRRALRRSWLRIRDAVDDLRHLGLMACVLSRSAIIEATAADPSQREQFEEVTSRFYVTSEEVVGVVRELGRVTRSATE